MRGIHLLLLYGKRVADDKRLSGAAVQGDAANRTPVSPLLSNPSIGFLRIQFHAFVPDRHENSWGAPKPSPALLRPAANIFPSGSTVFRSGNSGFSRLEMHAAPVIVQHMQTISVSKG
jgi:hypothetical protein